MFYNNKKFGYIYLYIDNKNNGIYLHYQVRSSLIPKSLKILNITKLSDIYKNKGIGSRALKMLDLIAYKKISIDLINLLPEKKIFTIDEKELEFFYRIYDIYLTI